MKLKNLRKKIRRLEKRLQEGPKKLAKLKQKLNAAEAAKAMKPARKSAARATAAHPAPKSSTPIEKKSPAQTAKATKIVTGALLPSPISPSFLRYGRVPCSDLNLLTIVQRFSGGNLCQSPC